LKSCLGHRYPRSCVPDRWFGGLIGFSLIFSVVGGTERSASVFIGCHRGCHGYSFECCLRAVTPAVLLHLVIFNSSILPGSFGSLFPKLSFPEPSLLRDPVVTYFNVRDSLLSGLASIAGANLALKLPVYPCRFLG